MSRVAKQPIPLPPGVQVALVGRTVTVKGPKGAAEVNVHPDVTVAQQGAALVFGVREGAVDAWRFAGTARANVNNLVKGVTKGFERKLELVGVGYRAQVQGKNLSLALGFSHPVVFPIPAGITIETPSQTEIVVKGTDKQLVGLVAAKIRGFRPPEPYKGKGVRYAGEHVALKEAKKK
ncbi:MAG TPA: 50S ribosomal protein L6 [Gammaproteobacteria bacterium]|nr:50S ribosomal protein L6 [Gammaproteobacteria bacterium]